MPEPTIDFRAILQRLNEAEIRYVVIGGVAMHLHGADNLTLDIDISFARDRTNTDALAKILRAERARMRGFPADLPFVIDGPTIRNATTLTLETNLGDFDLLAEPEGIDTFEGLWERAEVLEIDGQSVRIASIPDLIAMKQAADRPKDREHIMQLEAVQRLKQAYND